MSGSTYYYNRLQTARQDHDRLQQDYQQRQQELPHIQNRMTETLHQIRAVVIEAICNGERFDWTDTDEQVVNLFKELQERQDTLTALLQRDESEAQQANDAVHQALDDHKEALQALLLLDQRIESAIGELPEVQEMFRQLDDIELLTERMKTRKADAESEAGTKRQAYEADRYFQYLWQRSYNTPSYKAGRVGRRLDRWLAEACNYSDNQHQYELLLAIPRRLQAAIDESTEQLAALKMQISGHRTRMAEQMQRATLQNGLDKAAEILVSGKARVAEIIARIQKSKDEVGIIQGGGHNLQQRMAKLVDGTLANQNLKRFALATLSSVDDDLLHSYEQDYRQTQQLQSDSLHLSAMLGALLNEIDELNSAYSHAHSLEVADISARLKRHSDRSTSDTWFGGSGDSDGGFGGGGFKTGGGCGGGGFETGGGF